MTRAEAGRAHLLAPRFKYDPSRPLSATFRDPQRSYILAVKAKLESRQYTLQHDDCPCGAPRRDVVISEVDRYGLPLRAVLCLGCGTVRVDPYLDQVSLADFYTRVYQRMYGRVNDLDEYVERQRAYGEKMLAVAQPSLRPGGLVLEVGCGAGGAVGVFQANAFEVAGCDYSAELVAGGRAKGIKNLVEGSLEDLAGVVIKGRADLIYLHHVFEHVSDPVGVLRACIGYLATHGRVIVVVPDISRIHRFVAPAGDVMQFCTSLTSSPSRLRVFGGYAVASVLAPDRRLRTPWSQMPELWVEIRKRTDGPVGGTGDCRVLEDVGDRMLRYLMRTERLHTLGLCGAQLEQRSARLIALARRLRSGVGRVAMRWVVGRRGGGNAEGPGVPHAGGRSRWLR